MLAVRLAYFCTVWACWPPRVPKAVVITRYGARSIQTQQEGRFHYLKLRRVVHMLWSEDLVVMVIVRNHSIAVTPQSFLPELKDCGQETKQPDLMESKPGNSCARARRGKVLKVLVLS